MSEKQLVQVEEIEIKYVPIFKSFIDCISDLDDSTRLEMYETILDYGFHGIESKSENQIVRTLFKAFRPTLDKSIKRYKTNARNGSKGGAPKKKSAEELEDKEPIFPY